MSGMPTPSPAEAAALAAAARSANAEIWSYMALGWLVTILRTYARVKQVGWRNLQPDDFLVWVAAVFYALESAAAYSTGAMAQGLANNGIPNEYRKTLSPDDLEWQLRVVGSKIQIIGWSTYSVMVWCLKASLLFFCLRLTSRLADNSRIRVYIGLGLVVVSWLAVFITIMAECVPFEKNWQIYPDPGNSCNPASSRNILWVSVVTNVLTDLYIMYTPLPMLWHSTLRPAKKAALIGLFCGGFFVIACAIIRTTLMLKDPANSGAIAGLWSCRETFVATVAANLPAVFPLMKQWLGRFYGTVTESIKSTTAGKSSRVTGSFGTHDDHIALSDSSKTNSKIRSSIRTKAFAGHKKNDQREQLDSSDSSVDSPTLSIWKDVEVAVEHEPRQPWQGREQRNGEGEKNVPGMV